MKRYALYLPAILIALAATLRLHHGSVEKTELQNAIAKQRASNISPSVTDRHAVHAADTEAQNLAISNAAILAKIHRVEEAIASAEKETAALELRLPPSLEEEIIKSYGPITEMGAEFGQFLRLTSADIDETQKELKRRGLADDELGHVLSQTFSKLASWTPEISAFEDVPAEIASLQSSALRETFGLNDSQTRRAEALITSHFATMKTTGLTYASHDDPDWRERRSAALTQLLWQLRPLIPVNSSQIPTLPKIVNIGAGIETQTIVPADGTTLPQLRLGFPDWPPVPWLPKSD
ncbi:MAG: hypothetical protein R3F13_20695 [Prosthecobacter sp.]